MRYSLFFLIIQSALLGSITARDSICVHIFLLDDCVICQDYTPLLNSLHEKYKDEVTFLGHFPNFSSKQAKIDSFASKYKVTFPLRTDYYKTVSNRYAASVTPEVVVYNHTTDELLYQGRIDNRFYKLGRRRHVTTSHELAAVLQQLAEGLQPSVPNTKPVGCYINYSDPISKHTNTERQ